ncbi:MAG TPA: hypothetical protein VET84_05215 [Stellaceae bacterium]|jgi:hypothetical protein|nr:hypothetical protein [Stellaceae bacterium]
MSLVVAARLRVLSYQADRVAERLGKLDDRQALAKIARELVGIAEQLERDARD